ncbi:MAG: tRNA (adenosine(37)-N6)-dimethylallyltransferase MiaA [Elusimicrobiota bacterium]|jgi:tRNA dimethylallyltransferase|nr:tRNA (adenosine(37)-N6)-dimethylallyltransferase MiaA [Elusimicrobiota bacterium]
MSPKRYPIIIAGPTASGKTDTALALAKLTDGFIISADSKQIYKNLAAGTAAPKGIWQNGLYKVEGVNYHLVDFLDISESFDVSKFCAAAQSIMSSNAKKQAVFAGGTGMYLQGYFAGMDALPKAEPKIRLELKELAEKYGKEYLHKRLGEVDPKSAEQIPSGNIQRITRALEIFMITSRPASSLRSGKFKAEIPSDKAKLFYLNWDKEILNERIVSRAQNIFGPMLEEAKRALEAGYAQDAAGLKSLGYGEAIAYLKGDMTRAQALERIIILTRQYAKRQRTWFSRYKNMIKIDLKRRDDFNSARLAEFICEEKPKTL